MYTSDEERERNRKLRRVEGFIYSDMCPSLTVNKYGNVEATYDVECVKQSLINIFSTVKLERVRNPIGSELLRLLFQPINKDTARKIRHELVDVIRKWEPRVTVESFSIKPDLATHTYDVNLVYSIERINKQGEIRTRLKSF